MQRRIPPTENKLLLLYIITLLGATEPQALDRFALENELVPFMELRLSLGELVEEGFLFLHQPNDDPHYLITPLGRNTLEQLFSHIPYSRRKETERLCHIYKKHLLAERQVFADYENKGDGYEVRLYLLDIGATLMDIRLEVPQESMARALCARWKAHPSALYMDVLQVLLPVEEEAPAEGETEREEPFHAEGDGSPGAGDTDAAGTVRPNGL